MCVRVRVRVCVWHWVVVCTRSNSLTYSLSVVERTTNVSPLHPEVERRILLSSSWGISIDRELRGQKKRETNTDRDTGPEARPGNLTHYVLFIHISSYIHTYSYTHPIHTHTYPYIHTIHTYNRYHSPPPKVHPPPIPKLVHSPADQSIQSSIRHSSSHIKRNHSRIWLFHRYPDRQHGYVSIS